MSGEKRADPDGEQEMSLDSAGGERQKEAPKTHIVEDRVEPEFSMSKSRVRIDLFNKQKSNRYFRGTPRGGSKAFQFNDDFEEIRMVTHEQEDL